MLVAAAAVYFGGLFLPIPGIDHEALARAGGGGGLLGLFDASAVHLPLVGPSAAALVIVQVVLLIGGALERPVPRRIALLVYLALSAVQGFALALWCEAFEQSVFVPLVPEPGWGFRITTTVGMTAGAALLWWAFGRVDRSRAAHGALFLALLAGTSGALGAAWRAGAMAGLGQVSPLYALSELALPLALAIVSVAIALRPARFPVKLFGPVELRSGWDALAIPAAGAIPFAAYSGGVDAIDGSTSGALRALVGVVTLGLAIGLAAFWVRRAPEAGARPLGAAIGGFAVLALALGALALGFASAGGVEAALAPGPLAGEARFTVVLEAETRFADGDADAMVERIHALGARATIEAADARRVTLRVEGASEPGAVTDALAPRVLELSFTREFQDDTLAGAFATVPSGDYDRGVIRGWRGECARIAALLDGPPEGCDVPAMEAPRDGDEPAECTLHCLEDEVILGGADVADAQVQEDPNGVGPILAIELTADAAEHFEAATRSHLRRALAIVIDGEVVSAPIVMSAIPGGRVVITLGTARDPSAQRREASALAVALRPGGRIRTPFVVAEVR